MCSRDFISGMEDSGLDIFKIILSAKIPILWLSEPILIPCMMLLDLMYSASDSMTRKNIIGDMGQP